MVGYDPRVSEMPKLAYGLAGGMSGFLTRGVTQPLDVIKIRLQVVYIDYLRFLQNIVGNVFIVTLCNGADHYIFILFLSSFFLLFFPRLSSAVGDWMFTMLWHMVWP